MFFDNLAESGGAAHTEGGTAAPGPGSPGNAPNFVNCAFIGNRANGNGGAICNKQADLTAVNCLFSGNSASAVGAVVITPADSGGPSFSTHFINCTFSRNRAINAGSTGGVRAYYITNFDNCVLWRNESGGVPSQISVDPASPATPSINHCNIQGNGASGTNIDGDPLFADDDGGDDIVGTLDDNLRLLCFSPSIDTGSAALLPPDWFNLDLDASMIDPLPVDLAMFARQANAPDMGSYERQLKCCPADVNGDNVVNVTDLLAVISGWGSPCTNCTADIAPGDCGDGNVNVTDLLAVISNWGACNPECATGPIGEAGAIPRSYYDCQDMCTGLSGQEWAECMQKCFVILCEQGQTEFCDP